MKYPWVKFFTGDWLKDPQLSACSPATRGIWIDAICAMKELRTDTLAGQPGNLARILRCTEAELSAAVDDLQVTGAGSVTLRNKNITLKCRRLERELKELELNRLRQQRHRHNAKSNGDGTDRSQKSEVRIPPKPPSGPVALRAEQPNSRTAKSRDPAAVKKPKTLEDYIALGIPVPLELREPPGSWTEHPPEDPAARAEWEKAVAFRKRFLEAK